MLWYLSWSVVSSTDGNDDDNDVGDDDVCTVLTCIRITHIYLLIYHHLP